MERNAILDILLVMFVISFIVVMTFMIRDFFKKVKYDQRHFVDRLPLIKFVESSDLVQAAITEAVSRFYYDRVLSNRKKDIDELKITMASDVLSTLWNLQPDWRRVIHQYADKYKKSDKIDSLPIDGKPNSNDGIQVVISLPKTNN